MASTVTFQPTGYYIRPGTLEDICSLASVETSAATSFHNVSLSPLVDDPPMSKELLSKICSANNLKVAALASTNEIVGFIAGEVIVLPAMESATTESSVELKVKDGPGTMSYFHILELDTHSQHQRRGIGTALLQSAISECRDSGMTGLSLTTYRDVPFNGPFYGKFGFREVDPKNIGVKFEEIVLEELRTIHEPGRRCFMILKL